MNYNNNFNYIPGFILCTNIKIIYFLMYRLQSATYLLYKALENKKLMITKAIKTTKYAYTLINKVLNIYSNNKLFNDYET